MTTVGGIRAVGADRLRAPEARRVQICTRSPPPPTGLVWGSFPAMSPVAVVLAAGKGTRMGSDLPKVLHPLLGEPLVVHPIRAARAAGVGDIVLVVGHGA